MNTKRLQLSFALTLAFLTLAGALALLGAWGGGPSVAQAQGTTRYVAPDGTDAGDCSTIAGRCCTVQYAVDQANGGDDILVATGTYAGVNNYGGLAQVVYISKTVTIRGGYTTAFTEPPDPDANPTTLDAQGQGRVIYVTGDPSAGSGQAISPTIEGLRITGGDATGLGGGWWGGDGGGGVYVITATATISRNTITNNVASNSDWEDGSGGGVYLLNSNTRVINNHITDNDGSTSGGFWGASGWGGGLCAEGGAPVLRNNQILDNQAGAGGGFFGDGSGGGLYFVESQPTLEANQIRENRAVGSGDWGTGGGVEIAACPDFTLINNVIADNNAPYGGAGLWIGRMSGVPSSGRLLHTTIASNEGGTDDAEGVRVSQDGVVTMVNTILVNHDIGIAVEQTTTVVMTATLWNNSTDWDGAGTIYTGTINVWGDPAFLNPDGGDYHIAVTSPAVDEGVDAGVTTDIDGEPRDANPDIGADEAGGWGLQVVKAASATDLYPGDTVTYTIVVTAAGTLGVTNVVLTDTLPALQRPLDASPICSIADPGYGGLVTCDAGDLNAGQATHVTITAQVTTTLPATLPQTMRNTALAAGDQAQNDGYADTILHDFPGCRALVNGAGPEYTTVQAAVDAASAGDTVWIAGTCLGAFERAGLFQQVYITKSLTLRGGYRADFSAWNPDLYTTTLDASGEGRVVYVEGPVAVTVEALHLTGGDATGLGGIHDGFADAGGGLYAISATVTLSRTHVTGNVASTSFDGVGGGVGVTTATLTLVETTLAGNTASGAFFGLGYGGGLSAEFSTVRLERSRLEENVASGASLPGFGGGAYFYESDLEASATLWLSNTVSADLDWGLGGGLYVEGSRPFTLTNCVLAGNRAYDGSGESGGGLWVDGAPGTLLQPTIARNRWDEGVHVAVSTTVAITNAIIVSHEVGIRAMEGSTVIVNGVLWHDNVSDTIAITATVQVGNVITGTPAFAADGYHITPASQALDNGVVSTVTDDVDGDPRPSGSGYDLGADEYVCVTGVEIDGPAGGFIGFPYAFVATASPVAATPPITYTWRVSESASQRVSESASQRVITHTGGLSDTVVFTWNVTGPQVVTVTAVNAGCSVVSDTHTVTITTNQPPVADAGPDQGVMVSETVTLDGSGSYDPDGHLPLTYGWMQTGGPPVGSGQWSVVSFTFTVPGTPAVLTFTLTVTDAYGLADPTPDTIIVTIADQPITGLSAESSGPATLGEVTFFTATIMSGSNVAYTWAFGDGDGDTGATVSHTYAAAGNYTAVVTASNSVSQVITITPVTITNSAPLAHAGPDQSVQVGDLVTLDGSGSYDPDGHLPLAYGWVQTGGPPVTLSDGTAVTPTFTAPGTPTVLTFTLTVTDAYGLASTPDEVVITVEAVPCTALDSVTIAGPPTTTVGVAATFTATASPPGAAQPVTYTWRVSESASQRVITHTGGLSDTLVFTWNVTGPQTVTVTAVNECGAIVSETHTITVTVEAPEWYVYLPLAVRNLAPWASVAPSQHRRPHLPPPVLRDFAP